MTPQHPTLARFWELGQLVWLDQFQRDWLRDGTLASWRDQGVSGVTTNPAIFAQALRQPVYRDALAALPSLDAEARLEALLIEDVSAACDVFLPVYRASHGQAGYVSIEVAPTLAEDSTATVAAARRLWQRIAQPNVLIKIPATAAGIAAMRTLLAEGIGVNMTLIFTQAQWRAVAEAYRQTVAANPGRCGYSVASVFLSRIDTAVDALWPQAQGRTAVAQAKVIAEAYRALFADPLFAQSPQRLLWASTSAKNPAFDALHYVTSLVGKDTITTLPLATLQSLCQRAAEQFAETLWQDEPSARKHLATCRERDIDLEVIGQRLQQEGLAAFRSAYDELLELVRAH